MLQSAACQSKHSENKQAAEVHLAFTREQRLMYAPHAGTVRSRGCIVLATALPAAAARSHLQPSSNGSSNVNVAAAVTCKSNDDAQRRAREGRVDCVGAAGQGARTGRHGV